MLAAASAASLVPSRVCRVAVSRVSVRSASQSWAPTTVDPGARGIYTVQFIGYSHPPQSRGVAGGTWAGERTSPSRDLGARSSRLGRPSLVPRRTSRSSLAVPRSTLRLTCYDDTRRVSPSVAARARRARRRVAAGTRRVVCRVCVGCGVCGAVQLVHCTLQQALVVDSQSHHNDSVAIKTGAVAMRVGIRGYTLRFADSDGVRKAPIV